MPGVLLVRFELRRKKQSNTLLKMYLVRASNRVSSLRKRLKKKEWVPLPLSLTSYKERFYSI
jgi:hypothetical protein